MKKIRQNSDWSASVPACIERDSANKPFGKCFYAASATFASEDACAPIRSAIFSVSRAFVFVFLLFTFALSPQAAHRYHTSLTRVDYNAKDKNVEITIQLFIHDLEAVLERYAKKRIDAGKTPDVDRIIEKYLDENFVLKNKRDEKLKLKWVGKELNVDTAFVYLEISSAESIAGFKLQNTVFFESFSDQTNLLTARFENKKVDLLYKIGDKFKTIKEN